MKPRILARSLMEQADWRTAVCTCREVSVKRWILYACATTVFPYWESRFQRDESMANLVDCMAAAARHPSSEYDEQLKAAIPERERRFGDLSPPPGFPEAHQSDCPADFAGDSIYYAACAFIDGSKGGHDLSALETAIECLARLFAERDPQYNDDQDYREMADVHLRAKILELLATDDGEEFDAGMSEI